jgi:hypothetical protein
MCQLQALLPFALIAVVLIIVPFVGMHLTHQGCIREVEKNAREAAAKKQEA